MLLIEIFDIDKNVIQLNDNKNNKFLGQYVINITLEACQNNK